MGEAPRAAALIASPSLALPCAARLRAAFAAAVALPPLAVAAYQHFDLAARAGKHTAARTGASLDLITRRCNTLHALVANTVGRGGRNNLPVIAAAAPVLQHSHSSTASSPRRSFAKSCVSDSGRRPRRACIASRLLVASQVTPPGAL